MSRSILFIYTCFSKENNWGNPFPFGRGAYTGRNKRVLLTVVNNYQLKRLEEAVSAIDPDAFFITKNNFNII
jgi:uncharacterized membrane-anchored protein YitT (DUF2179 family)